MSKFDHEKFEIVRNLSKENWLKLAHSIVENEGWIINEDDYETYLNSFQKFTFYYVVEKLGNKAVGIVSLHVEELYRRAKPLCYIGFFFVLPEYRGNNIGTELFRAAFNDVEGNCMIYAVSKMWEKYRDGFGFIKIPEFRIIGTEIGCAYLKCDRLVAPVSLNDISLHDWTVVDFDAIVKFDLEITNGMCCRAYLLRNMFSHPDACVKVAQNSNGKVVGICRIRKAISGKFQLGPFYAEEKDIVSPLLRLTIEAIKPKMANGDTLFWMYPSSNKAAAALYENFTHGEPVESNFFVQQFTEEIIDLPTNRVYSIFENDTTLI